MTQGNFGKFYQFLFGQLIKTRQNIYWFLFLFSSHFLSPSFPFHIKNYFQNKKVGLEQAHRCSRSTRCIPWPLTLPVEQLTATIEQEVVPFWGSSPQLRPEPQKQRAAAQRAFPACPAPRSESIFHHSFFQDSHDSTPKGHENCLGKSHKGRM